MRNMKKRGLICLLALLLCLLPTLVRAKEEQKAKELTKACKFDFGRYTDADKRLLNRDVTSRVTFAAGAAVTAAWDDDTPAAWLCLQWFQLPEGVTLRQFDGAGDLLAEELVAAHPESVIPLLEQARSLSLTAGEAGMILCQIHIYGAGDLPEPYFLWQETPDHLDYLIISTHPDDDVLYMGSVVPIYGAEQGYVGTIVYVTNQNRTRMTEAEEGAWEMGLRYRPLFLGLPDIPRGSSEQQMSRFKYEEVLLATVRVYRQYHPVVVFAQDKNGEYGHWQHKFTSQAAVEAFTLAADPDYDPESRDQYGLWQVQKVYLHLYPENELWLDADTPLKAFDGTTAWNVARKAYQKHVSQQSIGYMVYKNDQIYAFNRFGMIEGVVEAGDDAFANVPEVLLSTYTPPPPTPTPEPTPTPTPEPTPTPTATPTPAPTAEPTLTPAPTAEPAATEAPAKAAEDLSLKPLDLVFAACVAVVTAILVRKMRSKKRSSRV